jgi:hypothetical protein
MNTFQRPETVILGTRVINPATGLVTEPQTSFTVKVTDQSGTVVVNAGAMEHQEPVVVIAGVQCNYTYDYNPADDAALGSYQVEYTAIDAPRKVIKRDRFVLE